MQSFNELEKLHKFLPWSTEIFDYAKMLLLFSGCKHFGIARDNYLPDGTN